MRKVLVRFVIVLLIVVAVVLGMQVVASETGEVVVVQVPSGGTVRLWVVDLDGAQYLRAGHAGASWYQPVVSAASVSVERSGTSSQYQAVPQPEERDRVNAAFATKYGWRDRVVGLLAGDRSDSMPIRLEPPP